MEATRAPHMEMVREQNRNILGTFTPQTIKCATYSIQRARELEIPAKEEAVLDYLSRTAGLDGRGREDLRDALMGARKEVQPLGAQAPRPVGAQW